MSGNYSELMNKSNAAFDNVFNKGKSANERVLLDNINTQYKRFSEIYRFIEMDNMSILDVGCGNGEFVNFLNYNGHSGKYTGIDINKNLLTEARRRFPDNDFKMVDILQHTDLDKYDCVIMSGLFNLDFGQDDFFVYNFVTKMFQLCNVKTIFNAISTHVNYTSEGMYYVDPGKLINYVANNISPKFEIRHSFLPCNYTISISHI